MYAELDASFDWISIDSDLKYRFLFDEDPRSDSDFARSYLMIKLRKMLCNCPTRKLSLNVMFS